MVETTISSLDVVVTGGPSTVYVDADFGPEGQRGSLILYGPGKPEAFASKLTFTPQILDWYINLDPSDSEYLYIYQYISESGKNIWKPFIKIFPNIYNTNTEVTFDSNGLASFNLNVSNTTLPYINEIPFGVYLTQLFNLHVNIPNINPVASSIYLGNDPDVILTNPTIVDETYVLPVRIRAAELVSGEWQPITGTKIAHISINMI